MRISFAFGEIRRRFNLDGSQFPNFAFCGVLPHSSPLLAKERR
jgi:hypothetical protein